MGVTIESGQEQTALGRVMAAGNVREVWTSGRLCDKEVDGCEQARFQPFNINGWFWAATLQSMGPTNVFSGRRFNGRASLHRASRQLLQRRVELARHQVQ